MAWSHKGSQFGGSSGGGGFTSPTVDLSNASLLHFVMSHYTLGTGTPTFTETGGNSWTLIDTVTDNNVQTRHWYCDTNIPSVSSAHSFTVSSAAADVYPCGILSGWSGSALHALDMNDPNIEPFVLSGSCGTITPSEDGCLILGQMTFTSGTGGQPTGVTPTLANNPVNQAGSSGNYFGMSLQWGVQNTAALITPGFAWNELQLATGFATSFKSGPPPFPPPAVAVASPLRRGVISRPRPFAPGIAR